MCCRMDFEGYRYLSGTIWNSPDSLICDAFLVLFNCSSRDFVLGFALVVIIHHLPVKHIGFFRQMSQNHLSKQRSLFFLPLRL